MHEISSRLLLCVNGNYLEAHLRALYAALIEEMSRRWWT